MLSIRLDTLEHHEKELAKYRSALTSSQEMWHSLQETTNKQVNLGVTNIGKFLHCVNNHNLYLLIGRTNCHVWCSSKRIILREFSTNGHYPSTRATTFGLSIPGLTLIILVRCFVFFLFLIFLFLLIMKRTSRTLKVSTAHHSEIISSHFF